MTTARDLYDALNKTPEDYELRLVLSDYLEESGYAYLGEVSYHRHLAKLAQAKTPEEAAPLYEQAFTDYACVVGGDRHVLACVRHLGLEPYLKMRRQGTVLGGRELRGRWLRGWPWHTTLVYPHLYWIGTIADQRHSGTHQPPNRHVYLLGNDGVMPEGWPLSTYHAPFRLYDGNGPLIRPYHVWVVSREEDRSCLVHVFEVAP